MTYTLYLRPAIPGPRVKSAHGPFRSRAAAERWADMVAETKPLIRRNRVKRRAKTLLASGA
jgi:hypothetical protein